MVEIDDPSLTFRNFVSVESPEKLREMLLICGDHPRCTRSVAFLETVYELSRSIKALPNPYIAVLNHINSFMDYLRDKELLNRKVHQQPPLQICFACVDLVNPLIATQVMRAYLNPDRLWSTYEPLIRESLAGGVTVRSQLGLRNVSLSAHVRGSGKRR